MFRATIRSIWRPAIGVRKTTTGCLAMCLWLSGWATFTPLFAGSGNVISMPANTRKMPSGFSAKVDTRWTDGWGYRPVRVRLRARKANRDRTVRIDLYPESYSRYYRPLRVSKMIEIPQGQREVNETIYVPQQQPWNSFRFEFYERGRKLKDLSVDYGMGWNSGYNSGAAPCLLMLDGDAPGMNDNREQVIQELKDARRRRNEQTFDLPDAEKFQYFQDGNFNRRTTTLDVDQLRNLDRANDMESLQFVANVPNLEILPPSDLPPHYVGLAGIDLMIISAADLAALKEEDAERFRAIDYSVRSGSTLVVYGAGEVKTAVADLLPIDENWTAANTASFNIDPVSSFAELDDRRSSAANQRRKELREAIGRLPQTFLCDHALGQVVAIQSEDPYDESVAFWQWVLRSIGRDRLTWSDRMGMSMVHSNQDYWDFMIPGFGAAPVKRFLAVICAFIIVVGPVNFLVLNRARRLYLLPFTVGAAALLTTIGMLGYAVISDGISTRVRLRSYTSLDQTGPERVASTHCRHAYLAAIAPSDGLIFPDHTCVYPLLPYYDERRREEQINSRTKTRVLGQGYLRSRSTTQFVSTDVLATDHGLDVQLGPDGEVQSATNAIGAPLLWAWVRGADGELLQAQQVDVDGQLKLQPVEDAEAKKVFDRLALGNRPAPPAGIDKNASRTMLGDLGSRRYYYQSSPVYSSSSLLEAKLKDASKFFSKQTPNTFVLVTAEVPEFIATGTAAKQEAGFHVIEGKW